MAQARDYGPPPLTPAWGRITVDVPLDPEPLEEKQMSKIRGKGLLGVKIGMTSIFTEDGNQLPVTVVQAGPNVVLAKEPLGNEAGEVNLRVGFGEKRESLFNKPELGFFRKIGVNPTRWQKVFRWPTSWSPAPRWA